MSKTLTEKLAEVRVGTHWETSMGVLCKLAGKPPSGALEKPTWKLPMQQAAKRWLD